VRRNRHPDLERRLGADAVHAQRREQANDTVRHAQGRLGERAVLTQVVSRQAVDAPRKPFEVASGDQPGEHDGGHGQRGEIARAQQRTLLGQCQHAVRMGGMLKGFHSLEYVANHSY